MLQAVALDKRPHGARHAQTHAHALALLTLLQAIAPDAAGLWVETLDSAIFCYVWFRTVMAHKPTGVLCEHNNMKGFHGVSTKNIRQRLPSVVGLDSKLLFTKMAERTIDRVNNYFERIPREYPKTTSDNGWPPFSGSTRIFIQKMFSSLADYSSCEQNNMKGFHGVSKNHNGYPPLLDLIQNLFSQKWLSGP